MHKLFQIQVQIRNEWEQEPSLVVPSGSRAPASIIKAFESKLLARKVFIRLFLPVERMLNLVPQPHVTNLKSKNYRVFSSVDLSLDNFMIRRS